MGNIKKTIECLLCDGKMSLVIFVVEDEEILGYECEKNKTHQMTMAEFLSLADPKK